MKDLINQFIQTLKESGKSHYTIIAYKKDLEQMAEYLQQTRKITDVAKVTIEDLKAFVEHLKTERKFNLKTVSRKINSIRTFFKFLVTKGIFEEFESPALRLTHPKLEATKPRILTRLEYRALRDVSRKDPRLYAMVETLLQTGLRLGELYRLKLSDIKKTSAGKPYLVVEGYSSNPSRNVPLNKAVYSALMNYINNYRPEPASGVENVFLTKTGRAIPIRNIRSGIKRAFKEAGIKNATVNDIRNTFIAYHLLKGMNLITLAKIVGHKRVSTTEKYMSLVKPRPEKEGLQEL